MEENNFKLKMNKDWFDSNVLKITFKKRLLNGFKRFFSWIGFYTETECQVISEPKQVEDGYTYNLKPLSRTTYWFHIPVSKTKIN